MQDDFRNKLIADHMEMAAAIASDCATKFNLFSLLPYSDLVAYAQQGLVEAASRYSPARSTFQTTTRMTGRRRRRDRAMSTQ